MSRACVTDDELQRYIERVLAAEDRAAIDAHCATCDDCRGLLAAAVRALFDGDSGEVTVPLEPGDSPEVEPQLATVELDNYEIDAEIARGGIGRVSRARDRRLGRDVALKELHHPSPHARERFIREALITARLEHPAIVPVHEAGRWPNGEPFYAMKLVSGDTLTQRIRDARSLADRLALLPSVIAVAEAAAYAHSRGVIHRDLKPANVLVGQFGETVVVDWGLAKHVDVPEPRDDEPLAAGDATLAGAVLGTPAYMPPEQARGEPIDERADVYALGAILYETLAGAPPYKGSSTAVLAAVVRAPPAPVEQLEAGVPRDLAAIVRKAMARDPEERYPTAKELAGDLVHFQTGQLVSARAYSRWALVQRWLRRNRLPAAVAAAALAVVATVAAVSVSRIVGARSAAVRAQAIAEDARAQTEARNDQLILLQARAIVDTDPTRALAWLKQIPASAPGWLEGRAVAVDAVNHGFARDVWRSTGNHTSVMFSPDGRWLVSAGPELRARVLDIPTGGTHPLAIGGAGISETAFAADGRMAAVTTDGAIAVFDAAGVAGGGAPPRAIHAATGKRTFIALDRAGRQLAMVSDEDSTVTVHDLTTGAIRSLPGPHEGARDIAFSPDGATIATISVDRVLRLHELSTGAVRELTGSDVASHLVFTPDGTGVITAELTGIRAWTLATGASRVLPFPPHRYISVAVSTDGATIAAAGFEGPVHLLDVASAQVATLSGHDALVTCLDFSPDGQYLVSTAMDHTTRLWQLPTRRDRIVGLVTGKAAFPAIAPDGGEVAVGTQDGTIARWATATGTATPLAGHTRAVFDVAYSPDGHVLASQSQDLTVRLWDRTTGASREVARTAPWVDFGHLLFSDDGRRLAASLDLETLAVIDVATGERVCTFSGGGFNLAHAFRPDGNAIAFTADQQIMLGDLTTCRARVLYSHDPSKSAYQIAFSRDGRYVASASDDSTVGLHDFVTGTSRRLRGHDVDATSLAFTPDGKTLASGGGDRTVRLWDVQTGAARVLRGHATMVVNVRFSPDGRVLASSGLDAVVHLWDVASGAGSVLVGHRDRVVGLVFAPDGRQLLSGSYDGTVRAWPADPLQDIPVDPVALKARLDTLTSARIDSENRATSRSP